MMDNDDVGDLAPDEDDGVEPMVVPDDVVDALPDQYEGDLDEDDSTEDVGPVNQDGPAFNGAERTP
jgi:hypothetical protein